MNAIAVLAGYVLATSLGAYCAVCVIRATPAFMAQDRPLFARLAIRALASGALCVGAASLVRWLARA